MTVSQLSDDLLNRSGRDLIVGICVIFAMSFVPASFVLYLISERTSKAKHLQYVSGVHPSIFWTGTFIWDMTNYLIPALICIIIFLCFQAESYVSGANFPCLCLLLFLYGFSVIPLMYPFSYLFSIPSTAYVLLTGINAFIGINCTTATYILDFFPDDQGLTNVNSFLKKVFLIFPQYCLGRGLFEMALNQLTADAFSEFGEYEFQNPLTYDIAGKHVFAMFMQGICFYILVLAIEHIYVFRRMFLKPKSSQSMFEDDWEPENIEEDVKHEEDSVKSGAHDSDPVIVKNLRKEYKKGIVGSDNLVAVKNLSFHVPKGECFGLLGVNGAGKTSTFNMLTGDVVPTSGKAALTGFDVVTQLNDSRKRLGFCPQFDALDNLLSVREHLMLYARLRGIEPKSVSNVAEGVIEKMGLRKYVDKQAGTLSGGNKRKLSTAIALVGNPQIIFLDEPTSGMDPKARRYLWQCIHDAVQEGRSVVLTSHSMEECEALCTRLAIMVNGQFKCLGSTQHIKTKYGDGYVVHVKMQVGLSDYIHNYFMDLYPNAQVLDSLSSLMVFQVPQQDATLSAMFEALERGKGVQVEDSDGKKVGLIEDYSISQTTLDQVFINFASEQNDDMLPVKSKANKQPKRKFKPLTLRTQNGQGHPRSNQMAAGGSSFPKFSSIGKTEVDEDGLLDNMSISSGYSNNTSAASLAHVMVRPGSAASTHTNVSEPTPLDDEVPRQDSLVSFTPRERVSNLDQWGAGGAGGSLFFNNDAFQNEDDTPISVKKGSGVMDSNKVLPTYDENSGAPYVPKIQVPPAAQNGHANGDLIDVTPTAPPNHTNGSSETEFGSQNGFELDAEDTR